MCEEAAVPDTLLHNSSCTCSMSWLNTEMISSSSSSTTVSHWQKNTSAEERLGLGETELKRLGHAYTTHTHVHTHTVSFRTMVGTPFAGRWPCFPSVCQTVQPFWQLDGHTAKTQLVRFTGAWYLLQPVILVLIGFQQVVPERIWISGFLFKRTCSGKRQPDKQCVTAKIMLSFSNVLNELSSRIRITLNNPES